VKACGTAAPGKVTPTTCLHHQLIHPNPKTCRRDDRQARRLVEEGTDEHGHISIDRTPARRALWMDELRRRPSVRVARAQPSAWARRIIRFSALRGRSMPSASGSISAKRVRRTGQPAATRTTRSRVRIAGWHGARADRDRAPAWPRPAPPDQIGRARASQPAGGRAPSRRDF
jgi:hypothetical protein